MFASIAATRDALLPRTELAAALDAGNGAPLAGLQEIYRFVFIGDLVSLVFCNGWREEQSRGRYTVRLDGDVVQVAPDPFGGRRIPVAVSGRSLPDRPYGSAADLIGEWKRAPRD